MKIKDLELDPRLPLGHAVQVVLFRRLENSVRHLDALEQAVSHGCPARDTPAGREARKAVHDFRKEMKKGRAVLRLARPGLNDSYDQANKELRDAARVFSAIRDATALDEQVRELSKSSQLRSSGDVSCVLALSEELQVEEREKLSSFDWNENIRQARLAVSEVRSLADQWRLDDPRVLAHGAGKTYRRGYRVCARVVGGETAPIHELRKRAKYHRYQLRMLRPRNRSVLSGERKLMKRLSSVLGDAHDQLVLHQRLPTLAARALSPDQLVVIEGVLEDRWPRFVREIQKWAPLSFAEKPSCRVARLESYIDHATLESHESR